MTEKVEEYAAGLAKLAGAEGELNRVADELYQLGKTVESSDELRSTLATARYQHHAESECLKTCWVRPHHPSPSIW